MGVITQIEKVKELVALDLESKKPEVQKQGLDIMAIFSRIPKDVDARKHPAKAEIKKWFQSNNGVKVHTVQWKTTEVHEALVKLWIPVPRTITSDQYAGRATLDGSAVHYDGYQPIYVDESMIILHSEFGYVLYGS